MRRLLVALALATLLPGPADATYAGQVRTATATFRLRGIDGHLLTLALTTRSSGAGGTSTFQQAELALTECAGTRCATKQYVTPLDARTYGENADLSVTLVYLRLGGIVLGVGWSSEAGYGAMPPIPATNEGVGVTSGRAATAVLVAGPALKNDQYLPVARCVGKDARVASTVGAFTADPPHGDWPSAPPAGLRVTARSRRFFRCA